MSDRAAYHRRIFVLYYPIAFFVVCLVHLLGFWVVTPFCAVQGPWIQLAHADTAGVLAEYHYQLPITVRSDGSTFLMNRRVDLEQLNGMLLDTAARVPGATIAIRADQRALFKYVKSALRSAEAAGFHTATVVTGLPPLFRPNA
jgi:biopolymer transport protein ExbD